MKHIDFSNVAITGGFWKKRQDLSRKTTVKAVFDRFTDTGRFAGLNCDWKEGKPNAPTPVGGYTSAFFMHKM